MSTSHKRAARRLAKELRAAGLVRGDDTPGYVHERRRKGNEKLGKKLGQDTEQEIYDLTYPKDLEEGGTA